MKTFSKFLPLTPAVSISRAVFSGVYSAALITDFLFIVVLEVIAFTIGVKLMKRRLIK
jgi:uncharacterized phage infection (PIP) family protein YhgE